MSWLRVDDGFANHPKVAQLSDRDFRVWMRTLCYCARYQDPSVDASTSAEVTGLTPAAISRFSELGLLDQSGGMHEIHDWKNYIAKDTTGADRQAKWRARNANRNGEVTAEKRLSRAGTRARPVPSPTPKTKPKAVTSTEPPAPEQPTNGPGDIDFNKILKAVDW